MANMKEFLQTGQLGPLYFGIDPFMTTELLGDPPVQSRRTNPLELQYGPLHLTFWRPTVEQKSQLLEIELIFDAIDAQLPEAITFTDFQLAETTTEQQFREYLSSNSYLPAYSVEGESGKQLILPSSAVATFVNGNLQRIKYSQKKNLTPLERTTHSREPSPDQIRDMILKAQRLLESGSSDAALLLGWAGLEAIARGLSSAAGLRQPTLMPPHALVRWLTSERIVSSKTAGIVELARQIRNEIVHGFKSQQFDPMLVQAIINLDQLLLERLLRDSSVAQADE